jgi:hypothetical protein
MVSLATGFLYTVPRGELWAIRDRNVGPWPSSGPPSRSACTTCATPFSSRLLAAGVPLIEVSAWMGHGLRAA